VVFFICGLWHGAGWNFILWGLAHAVFIIAETYTQSFRDGIATAMRVPARIRQAVQVPVTWVLILITYSLFRSEGPTHWLRLVERLPQGWSSLGLTEWAEVASSASPGPMWLLVLLLALPVTELLQYARRDQRALLRWNELPFGVRMVGDLALLFAVLVLGETGAEAFFYFQF
jgi:alginate O-acetyltransferase complex protein AlgI